MKMYLLREHCWVKNGRGVLNPLAVSDSADRLKGRAQHVTPEELRVTLIWDETSDPHRMTSQPFFVNGNEFYYSISEIPNV